MKVDNNVPQICNNCVFYNKVCKITNKIKNPQDVCDVAMEDGRKAFIYKHKMIFKSM